MKDKRSTHGIKEVYEWASLLAVENRDSKNMLKYYYWTETVNQLILRLRYLKRGARAARVMEENMNANIYREALDTIEKL